MIPAPKKINIDNEKVYFTMTYTTKGFDSSVQGALRAMSDYCDRVFDHTLKSAPEENAGLICECDNALKNGQYTVSAKENKIRIKAKDETALGYAFATLLQAMDKDENGIYVNETEINDIPESDWRGLMLDIGRLFMPVKHLCNMIDICWLYKINRLQLHLNDDPSYTLPSDAFPLLPTENRHYSKEDILYIRAYAKQRGVMIVPEIDMPGHSRWITKTYPEIFGSGSAMCAEGKTFKALEKLIDEVISLFPDSPYIHLGGDEADVNAWSRCDGCIAYMKEHGIENTQEMYAHYLKRITDHVLSKGRTPIIWEGIKRDYNHMISKDVIFAEFESLYQLAPELIEDGFTVINCSWKPLYIVPRSRMWSQKEIVKGWDIYRWQHWFEKSPASKKDIEVEKTSPVLGGQLCCWMDVFSNHPSSEEGWREASELIFERLPALAEKTWNIESEISMDVFNVKYERAKNIINKIIR